MRDSVAAILDQLECGRISVEEAIGRVHSDQAPRRHRPIRFLRMDIAHGERPFRIRMPFLPVAFVLMVVEVALLPFVLLALLVARRRTRDQQLARMLSSFPILPLTRVLVALVTSGAPLQIAVREEGSGFSLSVD